MRVNFEDSLKETLKHEGGYSNHPEDNGGATQWGIIQRVYNSYRRLKGQTPRDVRKITKAEATEIYRLNYWDQVSGDRLPIGLDFVVFDFAVNSGPNQAIKYLQRAINKTEGRTLKIDGHMGPATLDASTSLKDLAGVISAICDGRLGFMKRLKNWTTFGIAKDGGPGGWPKRVKAVKAKGLQMAAEGLQIVQERPEVPEGLGAAGDDTSPSKVPTWGLSITGLVGALGTGLVSAVNNPFALTFMLAVLVGAGYMFYSYGRNININN